jgi:quercetin dioxygenase-like cupin family protein
LEKLDERDGGFVRGRDLPWRSGSHRVHTRAAGAGRRPSGGQGGEVTYGPGEWSPAHSHLCAVIGYVIEGAVRMQVKGEPEATYKAGQSLYEAPNGVHAISANASKTERARFLAYFTCDRESPLTVAAPESTTVEGK